MGWPPARLWLAAAWICAATVGYQGSFCGGLNNCYRISMGVYQGSNQSLKLNLNPEVQKILKKCDPRTNTWEEKLLAVHGRPNFLTDKTTSVSLVNGNFTVRNAEKTEEGLYKIEQYLDNSCLAVVNVTLLDPPLPSAVMPSFDVSSTVTSKFTETPEASPAGRVYADKAVIGCCMGIFILIVGVCVLVKFKTKCRLFLTTRRVHVHA